MALVYADRVQDTTATTGTGTITLAGAPPSGYQSFAVIGNGNTAYYTLTSGSAWEVGIGTYSSTGPTLARTTILSSSAAGAAITLSGTSTVFVTYPAERAFSTDNVLAVASGGTGLATAPVNGALLIGNGTNYTSGNLTAGTGIGVANATGSITVSNSAPMTYPGAGIANSTGSAWGTSYTTTGSGTVAVLAASPTITGTYTFGGTAVSAAAWNLNGIGFIQNSTTYTDTTGTSSYSVAINVFKAQTYNTTNVTTPNSIYGNYFYTPIQGANVTASNVYALATDGPISVGGGTGYISTFNGSITTTNGGATFAQNVTVQSNGVTVTGASTITGGSGLVATFAANSFTLATTGTGTINLGGTTATGNILLGRSTATQTIFIGSGNTSSGNTSVVYISASGASGSGSTIIIGSATSGVIQTTTVNGRVTLAPVGATLAAWSTNGVGLIQSAATFTDNSTAASGTVATAYMNVFGAQTYAATNTAVTVSNLYGTYFTAPVAGTNVTATNSYALGADSIYSGGKITATGSNNSFGTSTANTTDTLSSGATTSSNTKTVNIGTGGLSGSTTTITIGSTAAPGVVTINGSVQGLSASTTSAATITPTAGRTNQYTVTALAVTASIAAPSGTPVDGQKLMIRIKDNGTAQSISFVGTSGGYRAVGVTLPTTTVVSKVLYIGCI